MRVVRSSRERSLYIQRKQHIKNESTVKLLLSWPAPHETSMFVDQTNRMFDLIWYFKKYINTHLQQHLITGSKQKVINTWTRSQNKQQIGKSHLSPSFYFKQSLLKKSDQGAKELNEYKGDCVDIVYLMKLIWRFY